MKIKLVADSSANICSRIHSDISYVPLRIITREHDYVDTPRLDVPKMLTELRAYKGPSSTACPSIEDWLDAFGDADLVYGVALTGGLSGCWNTAMIAAKEYMEEHPGRKVFILDSLSTGPELELILEKYQDLIAAGFSFEGVVAGIKEYHKHTNLIFSLETLDNFAKNGRVNPMAAKAAGVLGLRVIGTASERGTLEPLSKPRGEKKAIAALVKLMKERGCIGGRIRITHSYNPGAAQALAAELQEVYPEADINVAVNRGLCCYYAEEGGVLVAFESV